MDANDVRRRYDAYMLIERPDGIEWPELPDELELSSDEVRDLIGFVPPPVTDPELREKALRLVFASKHVEAQRFATWFLKTLAAGINKALSSKKSSEWTPLDDLLAFAAAYGIDLDGGER